VSYGTKEVGSALFGSNALGVVVPEDDEEGLITEVPLFDLTQAPRMSGSGPGLLRSVTEKDFERGLLAGLALIRLATPIEPFSCFFLAFFPAHDADDGAGSINCAVEDNRLSNCSSACTASAAAASDNLSNERLDNA
jgi:hypothetical protein